MHVPVKPMLVLIVFLLCASTLSAHAAQGQWGGFIYLFRKDGAGMSEQWKESLVKAVQRASLDLHNDFTPKSSLETIQFIRTTRYTLNGETVSPQPLGVIRIESTNRDTLNRFFETLKNASGDVLDLKLLLGVTSELRYTDAQTLERLQKHAPRRGDGKEQPNAVVFPLSKTGEWWNKPQDQRQAYFFRHPDRFGGDQLGHNEIGFRYIQKIYRKLYQSRFLNGGVDFLTYFEYADGDQEAFDGLLSGLRDTKLNPEWSFVKEKPIVYGKRVETLEEILR